MKAPSRAGIFIGPEHDPRETARKDKRSTVIDVPNRVSDLIVCPECSGQVALVKHSNPTEAKRGVFEIHKHRIGGGRCSWKRGDVPCAGGRL